MEYRNSPSGGYLLLETSEWTDDVGLAMVARIAEAWAMRNEFKVRLVVFMIDGSLRVCVAVFPSSQMEPTAEQISRLFATCSRPGFPGFDTVEVISAPCSREDAQS